MHRDRNTSLDLQILFCNFLGVSRHGSPWWCHAVPVTKAPKTCLAYIMYSSESQVAVHLTLTVFIVLPGVESPGGSPEVPEPAETEARHLPWHCWLRHSLWM